ncbi:MAG: hypothetical protein WAM39_13745 [Bryobacteraceae bacterium]
MNSSVRDYADLSGYFPVPPTDHYQDLRSEMVETMIECGLNIECHHHEGDRRAV